jgi:hypothetical protein
MEDTLAGFPLRSHEASWHCDLGWLVLGPSCTDFTESVLLHPLLGIFIVSRGNSLSHLSTLASAMLLYGLLFKASQRSLFSLLAISPILVTQEVFGLGTWEIKWDKSNSASHTSITSAALPSVWPLSSLISPSALSVLLFNLLVNYSLVWQIDPFFPHWFLSHSFNKGKQYSKISSFLLHIGVLLLLLAVLEFELRASLQGRCPISHTYGLFFFN